MHPEPAQGISDAMESAASQIAASSTPEPILNTLRTVSTTLNGFIGISITLIVLAFLIFLVRWTIAPEGSESQKVSARAAFRALLALFLSVNVWTIIWYVDKMVFISSLTAYGFVLLFLALLAAWSVFGITDSVIVLFQQAADWVLGAVIRGIRFIHGPRGDTMSSIRIQVRTEQTLPLIICILVIAMITVYALYPSSAGQNQGQFAEQKYRKMPPNMYAAPLVHDVGDVHIHNNQYVNSRYGIAITYPKGWTLAELGDRDGLVEARNDDLHMYSRLNAGTFMDLSPGSHDDFLTALWRIEKNIHTEFASSSVGIVTADTSASEDIASTSAATLDLVSYWPTSDDYTTTEFDHYYIFGNGPMYFTLSFETNNTAIDATQLQDSLAQIVRTIRITEPPTDIQRAE